MPLAVIFLFSCTGNADYDASDSGASPVAYVNGETITENELNYFKGRLRADVAGEYVSLYTCDYSDSFWTTPFGGKTPEDTLNERALDECVKVKLQLVLCREYGIYEDIAYEALYDKAAAYNAAHSDGQNAAGVKSIGLSSFYTYYLNNGVLELKNKMAADKLKPTDDEIARQLEEMSGEVKSALSGKALRNAAVELAVNEKYNEYIASLRKTAEVVMP